MYQPWPKWKKSLTTNVDNKKRILRKCIQDGHMYMATFMKTKNQENDTVFFSQSSKGQWKIMQLPIFRTSLLVLKCSFFLQAVGLCIRPGQSRAQRLGFVLPVWSSWERPSWHAANILLGCVEIRHPLLACSVASWLTYTLSQVHLWVERSKSGHLS